MFYNQFRFDEYNIYFVIAVRYNTLYAHEMNNLDSVYGVYVQGVTEQAKRDPANAEKHLANARVNFQTAIVYFLKSIEADPEFLDPYRLAAVTYKNIGDIANAEKYEALANKVARQKQNAKN